MKYPLQDDAPRDQCRAKVMNGPNELDGPFASEAGGEHRIQNDARITG